MAIQNVVDSYITMQTAGDTYNGNANDQTYSINPFLVNAGDTITIIDQGGDNSIELPSGLQITESLVVNNEAQLTLSNGASINIRGADTFTFNVGQNQATGDTTGSHKSFSQFSQEILGVDLPEPGQGPAQGNPVTVNDDGSGSITEYTPIDQDLTAEDGVAETFTYSIDSSKGDAFSKANGDWTVSNFNVEEDTLIFQDVKDGTLTTENFGETTPTITESSINNQTDIIFSNDPDGNAYQLTLAGIVDQNFNTFDFQVT